MRPGRASAGRRARRGARGSGQPPDSRGIHRQQLHAEPFGTPKVHALGVRGDDSRAELLEPARDCAQVETRDFHAR
jgi:hypothetical protein